MWGRPIVGYLLDEQTYCPACVYDLYVPFALDGRRRQTEAMLDRLAAERGLARQDLASYSSREFPKPIFRDEVLEDRCARCHQRLNGVLLEP